MDSSVREKYTSIIGLEVHVQLLTKSKIFSSDSTEFGLQPNTQVSAISLGHPGTLPKLNERAVEYAVKMGLACHSDISTRQVFDRKNYFYPDLPKGYQITQDRTPICKNGFVTISQSEGECQQVNLHRIHLEEDAGKSIHAEGVESTYVDFNRAGVALIEIVTLPEIKSSNEAGAFLSEVRKLVRYLEICDGNMEEGSMRCDANVSVMLNGSTKLGSKVEVKNMNSIKNVQSAIDREIERQISELENGNAIPSETRTFDAQTGFTHAMRTKEELNDYRYFPDPDLSPLVITDEWLDRIKASMPTLPKQLFEKFVSQYRLPEYVARVLTDSKETAHYFDQICQHTQNYKAASNWVMGPVKSILNDPDTSHHAFDVSPEKMAGLIGLVETGKVSFSTASQRIYPELQKAPGLDSLKIAEDLNLIQDSNMESILPVINEVIREFPLKVEEYRNGKKGIITMFMGEVMKRSKGKADPKITNELLVNKLNEK